MDDAQRRRWSALAHRNRGFCSPIDEGRFASLVNRLSLGPDPFAVDVGCGKAAALRAVIQSAGGRGTGIDQSPAMLAGADTLGGAVTLVETDARGWQPDQTADLAMCIGSTHIFRGAGPT